MATLNDQFNQVFANAKDTDMNMKLFFLIAEFGTSQVPLERCANVFGLTPDEAAKRAARAALPVPAYRAGSQKSPWLVDVEDLANYLGAQKAKASDEWRKVNVSTR